MPAHPGHHETTFATRLVRAGVGLITIQQLLGHAKITMIARYAHSLAADRCDAPDIRPGPLDLRNTYMQQWNFVVQRALTNNISMEVAYVGNKTTRLQQFIDRNDPPPGPGASVQAGRPFPQWGGMGIPEWVGKANYHSFQAKLDTRNWRGLQLLASYTASKCIDTGTTEGGTTTLLLPFNRAVCDFDRPQNFVVSEVYQSPVGTGRRLLSNHPTFNAPSGAINSRNGGQVSSTLNAARQI